MANFMIPYLKSNFHKEQKVIDFSLRRIKKWLYNKELKVCVVILVNLINLRGDTQLEILHEGDYVCAYWPMMRKGKSWVPKSSSDNSKKKPSYWQGTLTTSVSATRTILDTIQVDFGELKIISRHSEFMIQLRHFIGLYQITGHCIRCTMCFQIYLKIFTIDNVKNQVFCVI